MLSHIDRLRKFTLCSAALAPSPLAAGTLFWKLTRNLRVRLGLGSYHPDRVYSLETTFGRLYFRDNFGDVTNLVKLIWEGEYRLRELPTPGVILDVGANIGMAAVWFAKFNPGRAIHCFEPLPENAAMIRRNCPAAHVHQVAVGRKRERLSLQVDRHNIMASSVACRWDTREVHFDVLPLDEFTARNGIDRVALLKMDAEGMEEEILHGAGATLDITDRVVMETHGRDRHESVIALLRGRGFGIDSAAFSGATGLLFASRTAPQQQACAAAGRGVRES